MRFVLALLLLAVPLAAAETGENVLLVINRASAVSRQIGEYYQRRRNIPSRNVCEIRAPEAETISRETYKSAVERGVWDCLLPIPIAERGKIHILATTKGVPLRIAGIESGHQTDAASVDSELAMLPQHMNHESFPIEGPIGNPFYGKYMTQFDISKYRIYLVTRLTGFTFEDVRGMIDRCFEAKNRGLFIFDLSRGNSGSGDAWMQAAARGLPQNRVKVEDTREVHKGAKGVIGYASWGTNDEARQAGRVRDLGFEWLPGAIATEFVSTNARTFEEPPPDWRPGPWSKREDFFAGSPQALTGDLIRQGASGVSGHVYEPFLEGTPRPAYLFSAYYEGRTLAESFYLAIPFLSWMNVVAGDPLCSIGPP
jgi:uncharacterized protein (TIGR03790 family)